jgi:hypothetical protein
VRERERKRARAREREREREGARACEKESESNTMILKTRNQVVTPLINFARDRSDKLPADRAFVLSAAELTLMEARYHLARKGLSHLTIKALQVFF